MKGNPMKRRNEQRSARDTRDAKKLTGSTARSLDDLDCKVWERLASTFIDIEDAEEHAARQYCAPVAYWHVLQWLEQDYRFTFDECNLPSLWLRAVEKCLGEQPSAAARCLHRDVEEARTAFGKTQGNLYPSHLPDRLRLNEVYADEDRAWERFTARKEAALKRYLKSIRTGVVKRRKRRKGKACGGMSEDGTPCDERLFGRALFCEICGKRRQRKSQRDWKAQNRIVGRKVTPREISPKNRGFRCPDPFKPFSGISGETYITSQNEGGVTS